jgi:hypothetical protein
MRARDWAEIACQMPDGTSREYVADMIFDSTRPDVCWVAVLRGDPVMAFGVCATSIPGLWSAWAFGTDRAKRAIPIVTRYINTTARRHFITTYNPRRLEIRALTSHDYANRWLPKLGCKLETVCRQYGTGGEDFHLWSIVKEN